MGREALSPKFSCGTTVSSEIWTSKVFLTILHEGLLVEAVAWSAGRVGKRAGFKAEGLGFESSLKKLFAFFSFCQISKCFQEFFEVCGTLAVQKSKLFHESAPVLSPSLHL